MNDILVKTCSKHGEQEFYAWKYRGKTYRRCKICISDKNRKGRQKKLADPLQKEKLRKKNSDYWKNNKPKIQSRRKLPENVEKKKISQKKFIEKNPDYYRTKQMHYRIKLDNAYIKRLLRNGDKMIKSEFFTPELIELKKVLLEFKREIEKHYLLSRMKK